MPSDLTQTGRPKRTLSATDAVAVVVGVVIGAGIFKFPSVVAANVPSAAVFMLLWLAGGLISLVGALCYAELATTYPDAGGEYHFLSRALGGGPAFLFAWARLTVIQTGSIAIHAFIIGDYAADLLGRGRATSAAGAMLVVVLLTGLNVVGLRPGKLAQKILTACVVTAVLMVCVAGLIPGDGTRAASAVVDAGAVIATSPTQNGGGHVGIALAFVLFTFGGWNEAAYLSAEVRDDRRGIVKVLLGGIALVTAVYLLANFAYLRGLGLAGVASSDVVAADLLRGPMGDGAAKFVSLAIVIAAVGNMNATILTGARTSYALGRDFPLLAPLGRWRDGAEAPVAALLVQGAMTLGLVIFGVVQRQGLATMVEYTLPVFWFFFLLTGFSLFVLRRKDPHTPRPFRVPLYPLTPLLFCGACGYMLYSSLAYTQIGALVGVGVLLVGVPLMWAARSRVAGDGAGRGFESARDSGK